MTRMHVPERRMRVGCLVSRYTRSIFHTTLICPSRRPCADCRFALGGCRFAFGGCCFALGGCRQTGQAFRRAAARRPTFLLAEKRGPKMRPWRVGRAMKPHDYASWLRGSLKAHPCSCSELAESIWPPCGRFFRHLASPNRDEGQQHAARRAAQGRRFAAVAGSFDSPARSCWEVLDG